MAKAAIKVGSVTIDPDKTYRLTLTKSVNFLGRWLQPSDRNIKVTGAALIDIILPGVSEGVVDNAEEVH